MDHVIRALQTWLEVYEDAGDDPKAIRCIRRALDELRRYYG